VLDPFVGTGSLLIPPAHFGATVTGCDIDMRVLRGYSVGYSKDYVNPKNKNTKHKKPENEQHSDIYTNFFNYKLPMPHILRADINYLCFRKGEYFDMVVCDPPYGHRAMTRKTGMTEERRAKRELRLAKKYENFKKADKEEEKKMKIEESITSLSEKVGEIEINTCKEDVDKESEKIFEEHPIYFSPLNQCSVETIFENLLNLASQCLKVGGLLVCLYPTSKQKDEEGKYDHIFIYFKFL